jgi:hypothetical protein
MQGWRKLCSFPWYFSVLLPTRQIYRGFVEMPRSTSTRKAAPPPIELLGNNHEYYQKRLGLNRRFSSASKARLTKLGRNLQERKSLISTENRKNHVRALAKLGHYKHIGESPVNRSPPRSPTRSASPKGCVGWFCGLFGKGTRRRHR